jgi:MFS family permease
MEILVVGRIIQGFGSGLLTVALYVVVGQLYPARLRPRIFAAFATGWVVPSLVGPAIAGLIVEHASWRIVFLAVPAIAIPAALVMRPGLAHGAAHEAREGRLWDKRAMWAIAAAVGVGLLHYGGQQRGVLQIVLLVTGLAGVVAFAPRLLPRGTFTLGRGLPSVVALRGLVAAAGFGAEVFLPLMLTRERGLSPALAGLVLTVSALSWTAASWYRGRPKQPFSHSVFLQAGMVSILLGIATATLTLNDNVPVLVGILGWSLTGLGMGTVFPTLSVLTLEYSERDEQGANSSAAQLSDSLSTATVLAVGGSLFAALEPHSAVTAYLVAFGLPAALALVGVQAGRRTARSGS